MQSGKLSLPTLTLERVMTDKELLELAAKAAGITIKPVEIKNVEFAGDDRFIGYSTDPHEWLRGWFNPLTDDGDALRLAVKLNLRVMPQEKCVYVESNPDSVLGFASVSEMEMNGDDPYAATRSAIVRAAAEIGRAM